MIRFVMLRSFGTTARRQPLGSLAACFPKRRGILCENFQQTVTRMVIGCIAGSEKIGFAPFFLLRGSEWKDSIQRYGFSSWSRRRRGVRSGQGTYRISDIVQDETNMFSYIEVPSTSLSNITASCQPRGGAITGLVSYRFVYFTKPPKKG